MNYMSTSMPELAKFFNSDESYLGVYSDFSCGNYFLNIAKENNQTNLFLFFYEKCKNHEFNFGSYCFRFEDRNRHTTRSYLSESEEGKQLVKILNPILFASMI